MMFATTMQLHHAAPLRNQGAESVKKPRGSCAAPAIAAGFSSPAGAALRAIVIFLILGAAAFAQQTVGALKGQVADESGAVIPGATVTLTISGTVVKSVNAAADGTFTVVGLTPGRYAVRVTAPGMAPYENPAVELAAGKTVTLNVSLNVSMEKQEVTVQDQAGTQVSTDPSNNAGALVLQGADLDALSDDPDDLQSDLQALAGPSAGPNGGQIYIDGFTDGRLPPKESIREIRINQNPFSAEYDRLGYGRIEIFTKPGSDKFHGQAAFNYSNDVFNARNPFAQNKAPFDMRNYNGNVGGPLSKKASFFLDFERRDINDNAVINATILDPSDNIVPYSRAVNTPQERTTFSPRIDYQLSTNNTLTGRYSFLRSGQEDSGIGQFTLPELGYKVVNQQQTAQLTETSLLNAQTVDETRFQFVHSTLNDFGNNSVPAVNVLQAFTGFGSQIGRAYNTTNSWELQNFIAIAHSRHAWKFGLRVRAETDNDVSPQNFGGTFTFSGGLVPVLNADNQVVIGTDGNPEMEQISSIQRYQRTDILQKAGLSPEEVLALGGGASQFSIYAGNPKVQVTQADVAFFAQDDWRIRPNLTASLGLRYENQTNIRDWRDIAPRIGIAWAPGATAKRPGKTVIRAGFGMFYDRFAQSLVLQSERFNGVERQYIVPSPPFLPPAVPPISQIAGDALVHSIYTVDPSLRAPYVMQTAFSVERQLPRNSTMAVTYTNSHALHLLLLRDINAPLPGTDVRPYGDRGQIFQYESDGVLNQNQLIVNLTSRMNKSFTLFTFYVLNRAMSDADGSTTFANGSATVVANPYNLALDYGRAAIDARHRFMLGGSIVTKFKLRFSPFVIARSGAPFDITTGTDENGDTVFNDRPAFATDLTKPGAGVVVTPFGSFDPNPSPGEKIIPRNYGEGPAYFSVNLRLSRTFGFGPHRESAGMGGRPGGGPGGGGGRGGPGGGMMRGPGGGMRGMFGDATTDQKFNLILSISARNLFNTTNDGPYIGNLTSPFFGHANSLAGGFGPAQAASNRRLEMQLRFMF